MTLQKRATLIASATAAFLALVKFIIGLASGSVAILASAIDSILDLSVSLFNYLALHHSEKPADRHFNYGRGKSEAIASVIEGALISLSGLFILYESIQKLRTGEAVEQMGIALGVMTFSLLATLALVLFLRYVARVSQNLLIKADALHYQSDLLSNGAVLLSLLLIAWSGWHALDAIFGILIAFYILYSATGIIKAGVAILMDKALSEETRAAIIELIRAQTRIKSFHYLRTREAGNDRFVEVHLVFERDIMLFEAHQISDHIEEGIRALDPKAQWYITAHLDPYDDSK